MLRGVSSLMGSLVILMLFSSSILTIYYVSQMNSSLIRSEANRSLGLLRKEAELVEATYSSTPIGLNITVRNLGLSPSSLEYIVVITGDMPIYVKKLGYKIVGGQVYSFVLDLPYSSGDMYLVTAAGNFIPVVKEVEKGGSNSIITLGNRSVGIADPDFSYEFVPPYTLLLSVSGEWIQVYMENVSIIRSGSKVISSLDGRIVYFYNSGVLFIDGRYVDVIGSPPIGVGFDYAVFPDMFSINVYFSNGSVYVFNSSMYLGFNGGVFWFIGSIITLSNGSYLTRLYLLSDAYKGWVYIKSSFELDRASFKYPVFSNGRIYAILQDGELLYTLVFREMGVLEGHPIYSVTYIGSFTRRFDAPSILSRWSVDGDPKLGFSNNLVTFENYVRNQFVQGIPRSLVGSVSMLVWQNASSIPVNESWSGSLVYQGGLDELPNGGELWIKYMVFNKKAIYFPYNEDFIISIRLVSDLVEYQINVSIVGVHGQGKYSVFPVGWVVHYNIKELFGYSDAANSFDFNYEINYTNPSYAEYPSYTWFLELIGIRRAAPDLLNVFFINSWGDFIVRDNASLSVKVPVLNRNYQLEIWLYSHVYYDRYVPLPDWPDSDAVAGLYIHSVLFGGYGNGVFFIGPLKPRFTSKEYSHFTDFRHLKDIVIVNNNDFLRHFWVSSNKSVVVVSPSDYPHIVNYDYRELIGFNWYPSVSGVGFIEGFPGVYVCTNGTYYRVGWITDIRRDLDYEVTLLGDYILFIERGNGVWIYIYKCMEVG